MHISNTWNNLGRYKNDYWPHQVVDVVKNLWLFSFFDRTSTKNIQHPYSEYSGHFCLGIIYSRKALNKDEELKTYTVDQVTSIPAVIKDFLFFAEEKWKIASDKGGSGNTANIGSIQKISDILVGSKIFANVESLEEQNG